MANPLTNKLGPLATWQWLAIGGGGGLLLYLHERNKAPKEEGTELAGSTTNPLTEGATPGGGSGESAQPAPVPGVIGEPGPAGAPGAPGEPSQIDEARLEAAESAIERLNVPPVGSHTVAPQAKGQAFPLVNPANGEHYKVVHEKGKTIHKYHSGRAVVVGGAKSKTKAGHTAPAKHGRPKPLKVKPKAKPKPPHVVASHAQPRSAAKKPAKKKGKR